SSDLGPLPTAGAPARPISATARCLDFSWDILTFHGLNDKPVLCPKTQDILIMKSYPCQSHKFPRRPTWASVTYTIQLNWPAPAAGTAAAPTPPLPAGIPPCRQSWQSVPPGCPCCGRDPGSGS